MAEARITFKDDGQVITDRRGNIEWKFRRTGITRKAEIGEFYICKSDGLVAQATNATLESVEIVKRMP